MKDDKPLIFLSYADKDEAIASHFTELIERTCTTAKVWRSGDGRAGHGCTPGSNWFEDIHTHLERAAVVFTLVTPNSLKRHWIFWESGIGYQLLKHSGVIPVVLGIEIDDLKPPLNHLQGVDATNKTKLSTTMMSVAGKLGHTLREKDVCLFCDEFIAAIQAFLPALTMVDSSVLSDRSLVPEEMLDQLGSRLEKKLTELVGKSEAPQTLQDDQKGTQTPDPQIESAAQQSLELGKAGVQLPPKLARALAEKLYYSGDLQMALSIQLRLVELGDGTATDYFNLGMLLGEAGRKDEAEKAYREAIRIDPNRANAWNNLGVLLGETDRIDEAEKAYREAIRIDTNHAKAWYNLGNLLKETDRKDEAEKAYREAIRIDTNYVRAWCNLGNLLMETDRKDEAEKTYREAVTSNPGNSDVLNELAYCLWQRDKLDEALVEIKKALDIDPNNSYANATLGLLLFEKNELDKGQARYEKAVKLNPDDLPLQQKYHYEYGRALARNSYKAEAREQLELAKSIDSQYVPLEDIEAQLQLLAG